MNIATVLLSSDPVSIIRRHSGIISVVRRKLITSEESFLTSAPMTPRDVNLRYSKGRDFEVVLRNGYRKRGICARKVSNCIASHGGHTVQKKSSGLVMGCYTLQECEGVADSIGSSSGELGRVK